MAALSGSMDMVPPNMVQKVPLGLGQKVRMAGVGCGHWLLLESEIPVAPESAVFDPSESWRFHAKIP